MPTLQFGHAVPKPWLIGDRHFAALKRSGMGNGDEMQEATRQARGNSLRVVVVLVAGVVGAAVGRLFPPFVVDGYWWGTFLTSPGFGGVAAVGAAVIALQAARFTARRTARNADSDRAQRALAQQRSQWWDRFTWATQKATDPDTALVGVKVLFSLTRPDIATLEDARIAIDVTNIVAPRGHINRGGRPVE